MSGDVRRVNVDPLLEGIWFIIFRMFAGVRKDIVRLTFEQFIRGLADESRGLECILHTVFMILQRDRPFVLVVSHERAAWFDDQLAGTQGGIGFTVRNVDDHLVDAPLFWVWLELHGLR